MNPNIAFVHRFLTSLAFTSGIETIVLILLLKFVFRKSHVSLEQAIFAGLYASFSTISYVWFVFPYLTNWQPPTYVIFAEVFAFIVEAIFYRFMLRISWRDAFLASLICNAVSYFLGPVLRASGFWIFW